MSIGMHIAAIAAAVGCVVRAVEAQVRVIAGPGVPITVIGGENASAIRLDAKNERALRHVSISVEPVNGGATDPAWVWLTGRGFEPKWTVSEKPAAGALALTWGDAVDAEWSKAANVTLIGEAKQASTVPMMWMGRIADGREVLARAAGRWAERVPTDERQQLAASLVSAARSAGDRWRARAIGKTLGIRLDDAELSPGPLNVLAAQAEGLHLGAIGKLSGIDATLAEEIADHLVRLVRLPLSDTDGVWAPAWTASSIGVTGSIPELVLDPSVSEPQIVTRCRAWLTTQPVSVAWVRDDAGLRSGAEGVPMATLAAVYFGAGEKALAGVLNDGGKPTDMVRMPTGVGRFFSASATGTVTLRVADRPIVLNPVAATVGVVPPGHAIGALARDWTLETWRTGSVQQATSRTACILLPDATDPARWQVYVECDAPPLPAGADLSRERLRLWLGPTGSPSAMIEVSPERGASIVLGGEKGAVLKASVARGRGTWSMRVTLPASAVDRGVIRLGVDRVDATGERSSWPRPMLPWQTDPGRIAFDTTAWNRGMEQ